MVLAAVLIPLALIVGLGRELVPYVGENKPKLEQWLSANSGLTIRIGSLEGDWRKLSPVLTATNITLRDPAHPDQVLLTVPSMSTTPDWWATLRDLSPRLRTTLSGLKLTLMGAADGSIQIKEFASLKQSDPASARKALQWLVAQPGLTLRNNQLTWQVLGRPSLTIRQLAITQFNGNDDYRLQLGFFLANSQIEQQALLVMNKQPLAWRDSPWQLYAQLNSLAEWQPWLDSLTSLWPLPENSDIDLKQGDLRLWITSEGGAPKSITASLNKVHAAVTWPAYGLQQISALGGVLSMTHDQDGWTFAGDDLTGELNALALPLRRFAVDYRPDKITLAAARMVLSELQAHAMQLKLLPKHWLNQVIAAQPQGVLPRLHLQLVRDQDSWRFQSLEAEFKALSVKPEAKRPGMERMAGWLRTSATAGLIYFDTRQARLLLPDVFREPISVDSLQGGVRWLHKAGLWHIDSDVLKLVNADTEADAQFALHLPENNPGAGQLELLAGLRNAKLASTYRYVPWHSAGDNTLAWLKNSLKSGEIERASFVHTGPLKGGPNGGHLAMQFALKNAVLDYVPGWPVLSGLDAVLDISGRRLAIRGERGQILSAKASNLLAEIPDMRRSVLSIQTDLKMDLSDVDKLLAESPLKSKTAGVAERLQLSGPAQARLDLKVPLASGETKVKVSAQLNNAVLGLAQEDLRFEAVSGALNFDSDRGLDATALKATLWQKPASIQLSSVQRNGRWWQQKVQVKAPIDLAALERWADVDVLPYARGSSEADVLMNLPIAAPGLSSLEINSNLVGTQILLPAPLKKAAASPLPLRYQSTLGGVAEQKASVSVGPNLRVGIVSKSGQVQRALIRFGVPGLAWPTQPGISAELRTENINLADWQNLIGPSKAGVTGRKSMTQQLPALRQVSLEADGLQVGNERFAKTRVKAIKKDSSWDIQIRGLQPARWPNWPVTEIAGVFQQQGDAWLLSPLTLKQPLVNFAGSATWSLKGNQMTTLKGQLNATDIGEVMMQLGVPNSISSESLEASGELFWPGMPNEFSLKQSSGSLNATLKQGRLKELSGVNLATRIFGLVNASNLLRRLRFDFTDITRKGINYDKVLMKADLSQGVLKPAQFDLEGPTVQIRGKGWVNLNNQTLDQQLRVGVPVSSAVPVLAGFLAGPIVGGALVAADLLLDKQLAKLTSVRYRVSGNWDNLQVDDEALESLPSSLSKPETTEVPGVEAKP